jgi:dTDP-4-dehydrorhamnose reductase/UDP-glucose 4-epimerase
MILVVGKNSFISKEFLANYDQSLIYSISHTDIEKIKDLSNIDCVVNFAYSPNLYINTYTPEIDIDQKLAIFAAERGIHYVMISSRRVYKKSEQWGANEDSCATGLDVYGKNKILIEKNLERLLEPKLTILRPGNILGFETQYGRMRFGAYMLNQLLNTDVIRLSVSPYIRKDIIGVDFFCDVLMEVVKNKPSGVINVGAEKSIEIGQIALWILEGYGRGKLITNSSEIVDEFQLDSSKLKLVLGLSCSINRVAEFSKNLGKKLNEEYIERSGRK